MIMRRLQLKLENMATNRQAVGNVFQDTCTNLTLTFRAARSSCHLLPCDPISPYRSIDGCCNNFLEPALGKKLRKNSFFKILSIISGMPNSPFQRLVPPAYSDGVSLSR